MGVNHISNTMPKENTTLLLESYVIFVFKSGHYFDIKYRKCLQNYYIQRYPSPGISALAVTFTTTLYILERNKKHE